MARFSSCAARGTRSAWSPWARRRAGPWRPYMAARAAFPGDAKGRRRGGCFRRDRRKATVTRARFGQMLKQVADEAGIDRRRVSPHALPPFLRQPPPGPWGRPALAAAAPGPRRYRHDADLHPRAGRAAEVPDQTVPSPGAGGKERTLKTVPAKTPLIRLSVRTDPLFAPSNGSLHAYFSRESKIQRAVRNSRASSFFWETS